MIALIGLAAALSTLGELPQQAMAPGQCLTFLWTRTEPPVRIAMIDDSSGRLRIMRDGRTIDLGRTAPGRYAAGALTVTLDLDMADRAGLADTQLVAQGTLQLDEPGADSLLFSVGGLKGCAAPAR